MMTQTLALLLDAYRELNAKKMFWVVLILTFLVMAGFSLLGATEHTLTIAGREIVSNLTDVGINPLGIYKTIFSTLVVGFWLTWLAALLALISTAGIFPDFLSSGAIDLYLARPMSRLRLFFTKYLAGLLFVTLQVTLFSLMSFLILGIRAGLWQPGLFWAIPLVVLFFSYLFAICTFFGVWTRSTIAALLLTLLAWFGIFGIDYVERQMNTFKTFMTAQKEQFDLQIGAIDRRIAQLRAAGVSEGVEGGGGGGGAGGEAQAAPDTLPANNLKILEARRDQIALQRDRFSIPAALTTAQNILYGIKTFIPKTRETTNLLDRVLFTDKDLQEASRHTDVEAGDEDDALVEEALAGDTRPFGPRSSRRRAEPNLQLRLDRERSILWIVGTSLAFEAALLALAAWMFTRRDY
jgi:hypothetical protein